MIKKLGQIEIALPFLHDTEMVSLLMTKIFPLHYDTDIARDKTIVTCYCDEFREIERECKIPFYEVIIHSEIEESTLKINHRIEIKPAMS